MTVLTETYTLSNGVAIPKVGFGTWQIADGADAYDAVAAALAAGYRHIDTARAYGNEPSVARAIRDSGLARDDVFVTTKLPAAVKDHDAARASFEESLAALEMDHVDLYLIHAPWPWDAIGSDHAEGNAEAWRAMEEIHAEGGARSIGVSNFSVTDLEKLQAASTMLPMVNQYRYFIGHTKPDVQQWCADRGILVEAYSPLATGALLSNEQIREIADRYGKSVAQLSIRYALEKGVLPLPKTTHADRAAENADVDFSISAEDLARLDALTDTIEDRRPEL